MLNVKCLHVPSGWMCKLGYGWMVTVSIVSYNVWMKIPIVYIELTCLSAVVDSHCDAADVTQAALQISSQFHWKRPRLVSFVECPARQGHQDKF